ncbi:MAG: L-fuco-beta-pyranose dehydrogenase (EC [uncultured Aureispira sp.]|uniref:L-fuco-beta-pyranose dehydrogenase (EC) n=1 Tax=uncultured Aureispira sp. TaxID=1331704 RepID=A0A6S6S6H0_9BACT|nr:MAG: L-fuco-beta-pyranose dehydrogenase (EC [uncultured Aureispira sp.]
MTDFKDQYGFSLEEWEICLSVLKQLKDKPLDNPANQPFASLITKIHKNAKKQLKQSVPQVEKKSDVDLLKAAVVSKNALEGRTVFEHQEAISPPFYTEFKKPKNCYSCNVLYAKMHSFYHRLCPNCAALNYNYRGLPVDLTNRKVILTGGRVKVGYACALKFLKNGADLVVTTRFPALALEQFKQEADYENWKDRLTLYGLDLRNIKAVEGFIRYYKKHYNRLDILVNNAAQTIQYPGAYYQPLIAKEQALLTMNSTKYLIENATPVAEKQDALDLFKARTTDLSLNRFGQPVDGREKNSWNATLEEISTYELLEVNLINHISPYLMIKALTPLLKASDFEAKFIINVTSSEGQFSYQNKTVYHPHTNMTKAALNMLTRTSASAYAKAQIYMNSVDVGWVSTGAQESKRKAQFEVGYIPPLDPVDAAARILHPIHQALVHKEYYVGVLLKNFKPVDW